MNGRGSKRQTAIQHKLPDVLDQMSVCVEAGLGFDAALAKVVEKLKGHPLFAHVTLTRSERSPIAALVTEMLEDVTL